MNKPKSEFTLEVLALLALGLIIGFVYSLIRCVNSNILNIFALKWEITSAILYLTRWLPAILLVSSAIFIETAEETKTFIGSASKILTPSMVIIAIITVFIILLHPVLESTQTYYESQSTVFHESIQSAKDAIKENKYKKASIYINRCSSINPKDKEYEDLKQRIEVSLEKQQENTKPSSENTSEKEIINDKGGAANTFYLDAIKAKEEGRLYDAHYLAKRSALLNNKRPEVQRLITETYNEIQNLTISNSEKEKSDFYKQKLKGYNFYQDGDYLEAYKIYSMLKEIKPSDPDVETYLEKSTIALDSISFFIDEEIYVFSQNVSVPLNITIIEEDKKNNKKDENKKETKYNLICSQAAGTQEALYMRDVQINIEGEINISVKTKYARMHGNTIVLRAIDRNDTSTVWNPEYQEDKTQEKNIFSIEVPFNHDELTKLVSLCASNKRDIPISTLSSNFHIAKKFKIDTVALYSELARRIAIPFEFIILILLGISLGIRFRQPEQPSKIRCLITSPILIAFLVKPIELVQDQEQMIAKVLASFLPNGFFMPVCFILLSLLTVACIFLSARIAMRNINESEDN